MRFLLVIFIAMTISACGLTTVKPWERDVLARENMQLDTDALLEMMDEQIYYSKEAAHGGQGVGGGGCGCN